MTDEIRFLGNIERLELKPGDKFVLMINDIISLDTHDRLQKAWRKFIGGDPDEFKLLILQKGMKIGVINKGEDI